MNRQSIHQQVDSLLKIIRDQHEQIKNHPSSIPQVEIDFMVQNLRQLFEAGLMLNHTNALTSLDEVKTAVTQKILAEKRALEIKKTEEPAKEKQEIAETIIPVQQEIAVTHVAHPMNQVIANIGTAEPVQEEKAGKTARKKSSQDVNHKFEDKPTLGDTFGNGESLHRKFASNTSSKTLGDKLHHKPIADLKAAIGINEKFLFVNQLFEGNLQHYSSSVERINSTADLNGAKQIAADLAGQLNWDDKNEHVQHFMELVERRFSTSPIHS
ncbi:MAG: hypothetical protein ABI763_07200 [Bacteroidota bacterium]